MARTRSIVKVARWKIGFGKNENDMSWVCLICHNKWLFRMFNPFYLKKASLCLFGLELYEKCQ